MNIKIKISENKKILVKLIPHRESRIALLAFLS